MKNIQVVIGTRLRASRKARGLTLEELSVKAGVNPAQIGKIERGERNFTINTLHRIIAALDIEYKDLFDFKRELPTPADPMIYKTLSQLKTLSLKEQQLIYNTAAMLAEHKTTEKKKRL